VRFQKYLRALLPNSVLSRMGVRGRVFSFAFDPSGDVKDDIRSKYGFEGDLLDILSNNKGNIVHKWHHYIPIYDRYFSRFRGQKVKFLEIGVSKGGSLQVWREYFGNDAVIFGIDIDPACKKYDGRSGQVRIGSQADPDFLNSVIEEMGGVDIVLDDGSHQMEHIKFSLAHLFPKVTDGGLYMIEDLHTAYYHEFGGAFRSKSSFFHDLGLLIEDMHHWYHGNPLRMAKISKICSGIHVHDSIVVLDRGRVHPPTHSEIG
jgi:hypothetical protein